jgi:hypothetical protein
VTILNERRESISIAKDDGFSYHCAKRIIEKDIFGASIHCACQCNSVTHKYSDNVKFQKLLT